MRGIGCAGDKHMPYKRKESPYWWASFIDANGKRVRCSTGTTKRKEAQALEAKWRAEAFQTTNWGKQPSHSVDDLMLDYLKATKSKKSHERDRYSARALRRFFAGRDLISLKGADIKAYQTKRLKTVKSATVNRELGFLSSAINYAKSEWEWDIPNLVEGRKLPKPGGRTRHLSRKEVGLLMAAIDQTSPAAADLILLAVHTGCRRGELLELEWNRVDLKRNEIYLDTIHTKNSKPRTVAINSAAREALIHRASIRAKHCPDSPWVFVHTQGRWKGHRVKSCRRAFQTACKRAGIADFTFLDLRHTCASWLVQGDVHLLSVR
ncbi:uncharacterized protein METZ01_LOCUS254475, partial [marine metagenome]